jgi:hypothetical protein
MVGRQPSFWNEVLGIAKIDAGSVRGPLGDFK